MKPIGVIALLLAAASALSGETQISIRSAQPGNVFTDRAAASLSVTISGDAPSALRYTLWDPASTWGQQGDLPAQLGTQPLVLRIPRGLYRLEITAVTGDAETRIAAAMAVLPEPDEAGPSSYWGIMTIPYDGPVDQAKSDELALSHRLFGGSWSRLSFWLHAYEGVGIDNGRVTSVKMDRYKSIARAMKARGMTVMGEFCQIPESLSSQPGKTEGNSDAGPLFARVRPRDWNQWEQFAEAVARELRDCVDYFEVGNEVNIQGRYWADTPETYAEWLKRTRAGVLRGNPNAKIVAGGFTTSKAERENGPEFIETIFRMGAASQLDVFSSHGIIPEYPALLKRHGKWPVPMWNTECHYMPALADRAAGVERIFHFIHRLPMESLGAHLQLTDMKGAPTQAGVSFANIAKVCGPQFTVEKTIAEESMRVYIVRRADGEMVGVASMEGKGRKPGRVRFTGTPLPGKTMQAVNWSGRATDIASGTTELALDGIRFVRGCKTLEVASFEKPSEYPEPEQSVFSSNDARWFGKWGMGKGKSFYVPEEPSAEGYYALLTFEVPKDGEYRLYMDGTITSRLGPTRSISPFIWSIDGKRSRFVNEALPSIYRKSSHGRYAADQPVERSHMEYLGGHDIWQELATAHLSAGKHTFRIELVDRRNTPDSAYCFEFLGLMVRPVTSPNVAGELLAAASGASGKALPLANGSFEQYTPGDGRVAPAFWQKIGENSFVGDYPRVDGSKAVQLYPKPKTTQQLVQDIPSGKLTAQIGRPLKAGDTLRIRASVRHYWEEGGMPPAAVRIGVLNYEPGGQVRQPTYHSLDGKKLPRDQYQAYDAMYTVTADDEAAGRPMWRFILETQAGDAGQAGTIWDHAGLWVE